MSDRLIPKRALTPEQVHALKDEDLLSRLSEQQKKDVMHMTRATFPMKPPAQRPDESYGQWKERCREAKEVDQAEFGRTLRANAEGVLIAAQGPQRIIDALSADITTESVQKRKEAEAERAERQRLADLESGGLRVVNPIVGWETGKDKK